MSEQIVNLIPTSTGKVRTVCFYCDRTSRPRRVDAQGRPSWSDWPRGWSEACMPPDYVQLDGSLGSTWTCPACNRLASERQSAGLTPLLSPSRRRARAIAEGRSTSVSATRADRT